MDTSRYIQSCNPARFVVTSAILLFSILFALRRDEFIRINYWLVFLPLLVWKMLVVFGACTGVLVWCKHGDRERILRRPDNDCRELIIYLLLHILILTFEILTCDKLQNETKTSWLVCFIPLFICTLFAFFSCLWSLKVQRSFLIQAFISANGFFFLFFPLRLDLTITWRYVVVFVPVWITLCIALLFVMSKMILAIIHRCSRRLLANQRELSTITEAVLYAMMFIPLTVFAVLLVERLDYESNSQTSPLSFTVIAIPLWVALIAWLTFSFGATDSNPWWFGLRRDVCEILLGQCPAMTLYFNNQFKMGPRPSTTVPTNDITIDISATPAGMSAATASKHFENIHMNQRMAGHPNQEKDLGLKYNCMSLLEPD